MHNIHTAQVCRHMQVYHIGDIMYLDCGFLTYDPYMVVSCGRNMPS
jgi:hypothetical protein